MSKTDKLDIKIPKVLHNFKLNLMNKKYFNHCLSLLLSTIILNTILPKKYFNGS